MPTKKAIWWSIAWIALSLGVGLVIWYWVSKESGYAFLAGYVIEKALSVDNLFVFLMLFTYFKVGPDLQRRVLNWGVIGVIILRGLLIFAGIGLVNRFEWLMYLFGVVVLYTGYKMAFGGDDEFNASESRILKVARNIFTVSEDYHGDRFFIKENGRTIVTPLFIVLVVVEFTDVLFAFDSIPAIFSITRDPLVVFGSNLLAVLGLRSLYFLLERLHSSFRFVKIGVGVILGFVGLKMLTPLFWSAFAPSTFQSLIVIAAILIISIMLSIALPATKKEAS